MLLAGGDSSRSENAILVELAADRGNLNMTQFLIEGGADVTKLSSTALQTMETWNSVSAGSRLERAGINHQNSGGFTPVNIAAKQGHKHLPPV